MGGKRHLRRRIRVMPDKVYFTDDGKVLFTDDGKVAMDEACCCHVDCSVYTAAPLFVTLAGINPCVCVPFGEKFMFAEFDDDPNGTFLLTNIASGVVGVTSWEAALGSIFICTSPGADPACEGCSRGGFEEPPEGHTWELVTVKALVQCGPGEDGGNDFAISVYGIMESGLVVILFLGTLYADASADCLTCWTLGSSAGCGETGTLANAGGGTTDFWDVTLVGRDYVVAGEDGIAGVST